MFFSYLTSAFAICGLLSGACIPCPDSLLQHTFSGCLSILLKETHSTENTSQRRRVEGWKKGPITNAGHDITAANWFHIL